VEDRGGGNLCKTKCYETDNLLAGWRYIIAICKITCQAPKGWQWRQWLPFRKEFECAGRSKSYLERRTQTDAVCTAEGRVKCVQTQIWTLEGGVPNVAVGNLEGGYPPSII
jgi:hypothetical protein